MDIGRLSTHLNLSSLGDICSLHFEIE